MFAHGPLPHILLHIIWLWIEFSNLWKCVRVNVCMCVCLGHKRTKAHPLNYFLGAVGFIFMFCSVCTKDTQQIFAIFFSRCCSPSFNKCYYWHTAHAPILSIRLERKWMPNLEPQTYTFLYLANWIRKFEVQFSFAPAAQIE